MTELKPCPCCGCDSWLKRGPTAQGMVAYQCKRCGLQSRFGTESSVIADLNKRVSPWVSVDMELPEEGHWYLISTTHPEFNQRISTMAFLDSIGDGVIWLSHNDKEDDYSEWENVTHWMPLPELPTHNLNY